MVKIPDRPRPAEPATAAGATFEPGAGVDQQALARFVRKANADARPSKGGEKLKPRSIRMSDAMHYTIAQEAEVEGGDFSEKAREFIKAGMRALGVQIRTPGT